MQMVSYWTDYTEIYSDSNGFTLITGMYNHKKSEMDGGSKCLGVHWGDYPVSHNVLCPCVIPKETRNAILAGLLHQSVLKNDLKLIEQLTEAIKYFQ